MANRIRKIALEEHFMAPGFQDYSKAFTRLMKDAAQAELAAKLDDFHEARIADMDRAGIEICVLSPTIPSVQGETDAAVAAQTGQSKPMTISLARSRAIPSGLSGLRIVGHARSEGGSPRT